MDKSKIEWTDSTWNPVMGCTPISEGCGKCYARTMIGRYKGLKGWPESLDKVTLFPERLEQPFRWKKPRRIFVCSMGDLFHEDVPFQYIAAVFGAMAANPQHTFKVLTKRPERMKFFFEMIEFSGAVGVGPQDICAGELDAIIKQGTPDVVWPLPNLWLGVSVENQVMADERIPKLLQTPAAKRFVSCEPLISSLDLSPLLFCDECNDISSYRPWGKGAVDDPLSNAAGGSPWSLCFRCYDICRPDWIIVGAETGPGKRTMDRDWARNIRGQCKDAGVAFFFKKDSNGSHELDGRVWEEMPI